MAEQNIIIPKPTDARFIDITGETYGKWTVLRYAGKVGAYRLNGWLCRCECGNEAVIPLGNLRSGASQSCVDCGRTRTRKAHCSHGDTIGKTQTPEYRAFANAKTRCQNPKTERYHLYGGRGIEFRFESFDAFLAELGRRPAAGYSVNRIDNDGHYEPGNVEWATATAQANNRRDRRKRIVHNT